MTTTAPTHTDRPGNLNNQPVRRHLLDQFIPDPSGLTPLCDEADFVMFAERIVADEAPRLFAVVQEYGERVDGRVAAWGMAFDDHAEVVAVAREMRASLRTPESALRMFTIGSHIHARLVWVNPDATTPPEALG